MPTVTNSRPRASDLLTALTRPGTGSRAQATAGHFNVPATVTVRVSGTFKVRPRRPGPDDRHGPEIMPR
jgi:hypothetical protein